jgi:hypothetical protein
MLVERAAYGEGTVDIRPEPAGVVRYCEQFGLFA